MAGRFLIAAVGSLLFASVARTDLPLPDNLRYIDPRVAFAGVEKYPDHVFYLRFFTFHGGPSGAPPRLIAVRNANAFSLGAQRRLMDMKLLAIKRSEFEKHGSIHGPDMWLTDKTEGVITAKVAAPSTVAPKDVAEVPVTSYRVLLQDGKLTVEMVEQKKVGEAAPTGRIRTWVAGISIAAAIVGLGLMTARRKSAKLV